MKELWCRKGLIKAARAIGHGDSLGSPKALGRVQGIA